jgi:hypothetical protein
MLLFIYKKGNTKLLANCIFAKKNLEIFTTLIDKSSHIELEYFKLWIKYLYDTTDYQIEYIGNLNYKNPSYKFDIIIDEETEIINIKDSNKSVSDFLNKNNIIINQDSLYTFDENEIEHSLFLYKEIKKYSKGIIKKYNSTNEDDYDFMHPVVVKFFHKYKIFKEIDQYYINQAKEYEYVLNTFDEIKYNYKYGYDYNNCNIQPELISVNLDYYFDKHYYLDELKNWHIDEEYCPHLINLYLDCDENTQYKDLSDENKINYKLIKKELKCLYKNINKIPNPKIYIDKIYTESTEQLKYISKMINNMDKSKKELLKIYQLAYITQYCRQFKFSYNNYLFIHENIEAVDFKLSTRYHFIMNEYSNGLIDEDDFYNETKFFIKFNFGYLYFNHIDNFNNNTGFVITQFKVNGVDEEIYPHFYNHLCLLMEHNEISISSVRERDAKTYE